MKINSNTTEVHGTHLQGYVTTTRDHIESVLGEPLEYGEGSKVTTEWVIEFEDGTVATIYDWKRYEDGAPDFDEVYEWHIGGKTWDAALRVSEALGKGVGNFSIQPFAL